MDMEGALRARLIAAAPVNALVFGRVYWVTRPQNAALPAITLQHVNDERGQSYEGFDGLQPGYVQVDIWALSYAQARQLKEAVIDALAPAETSNGIHFTRAFVNARDLSERTDTQFLFRPSLDFTFHYANA